MISRESVIEPIAPAQQAGERGALRQAERGDERAEALFGPHVIAGDHEPCVGTIDRCEGADQPIDPLARRQLAEKQNDRCGAARRQREPPPEPALGQRRGELVEIDRVGHDANRRARNAEQGRVVEDELGRRRP